MPDIYKVVKDGIVVNMIYWDGIAPYTPDEGCTLIKKEDNND